MVPLLGTQDLPMVRETNERPKAVAGPRGSAAYIINQYLFEHSRR